LRDPDQTPKLFGFDANRVVAFAGPHIAWVAGALATWLMSQTDIFATFDVSNETLAGALSQALVFGVVTLVVWLGQHKWLDGFQKWAYEAFEGFGENNEDMYIEQAGKDPVAVDPQAEAAAGFAAGEPPVDG
jgi:hypothetical protein